MKVTFSVDHSTEFRRQNLIETGEQAPANREMTCDARDMRPDHRRRYLSDRIGSDSPRINLVTPNRYGSSSAWEWDGLIDDVNTVLDLHASAYDAAKAKIDAEDRERQEASDAREREDAERKEAKAKREAEGREAIKSWGMDHGSELLRERIKNGFDFVPLAGKEYAREILAMIQIPTEEVPNSFSDDYSSVQGDERTTPDLAEIRNLRVILDSIERENLSRVASAGLRWITYHDQTGDLDDLKRSEIHIEVIDPTGNDHDFYFLAN